MKKEKLILMFAVVCLMSVAGPAWALPHSTHQMWTFSALNSPLSLSPEVDENPYGTASASISSGRYEPDPQWYDSFLDRLGVWYAESIESILLEIPNRAVPDPAKEIFVEIGFHGQLNNFAAYPVPAGGVVELISQEIEIVDTNWKKLTTLWHVEPNPDLEYLCYDFSGGAGAAVDYVIVDTICIPEPLTICLLGFGGLLLRRLKTL